MATSRTTLEPRFRRLRRALGLPTYSVLGLTELLWQYAYGQGRADMPAADVEEVCEWDGEPGALFAALLDTGWLDDLGDGRVGAVGFWENAPAYLINRKKDRDRKREERAKIPASSGLSGTVQDCPGPSGTNTDTSGTVQDCPTEENGKEGKGNGRGREENTPPTPQRGGAAHDPAFLRFWQAYPRKEGKEAASKAWDKLKPNNALGAAILEAVRKQSQTPQWFKENGKYIPHASTWLNGRRWEDEGIEAQTCGDGSPVPWEEA